MVWPFNVLYILNFFYISLSSPSSVYLLRT
uniref:Acetyltransferase-related family protein n=1 Tax=Rhizophora mucronata TaxID=61149 RepID=A0A2P2KD12_RHIMU